MYNPLSSTIHSIYISTCNFPIQQLYLRFDILTVFNYNA